MQTAKHLHPNPLGLPALSTARVEPDDAELVERSRADDRGAFGLLVDRHKDRVVNYLTRLTGCRDRAEDFAQDTFVRLYQNLESYRDEGALVAYVMRIATNLVRSAERRKKRWKVLEPLFQVTGFGGALGVASSGNTSGSPQARVLASEEQRQVNEAVAALDMIYRAPLVMREIEGLSYQEIATALEVNEGTVKSRLHRARALLKEKLTPYWKGGDQRHG